MSFSLISGSFKHLNLLIKPTPFQLRQTLRSEPHISDLHPQAPHPPFGLGSPQAKSLQPFRFGLPSIPKLPIPPFGLVSPQPKSLQPSRFGLPPSPSSPFPPLVWFLPNPSLFPLVLTQTRSGRDPPFGSVSNSV